MLITSGPSQLFVSPPAIGQSNSAASGKMPSYRPLASDSPPLFGSASETSAARGLAAIAARSLRFTASDLRPMRFGSCSPRTKIDAVHQHVGRRDEIGVVADTQNGRVVAQAHESRG